MRRLLALCFLTVACGDAATVPSPDGGGSADGRVTPDGAGSQADAAPFLGSERALALDVIESTVAALEGGDFDSNTAFLLQILGALPQIAASGASPDGSVWAVFGDGVVLMVVPVAPPEAVEPTVARAALPPPPAALAPRPQATAGCFNNPVTATGIGTVPRANRFRLLNGLGSFFSSGGYSDPRPGIQAMLTANGYTGSSADATLANLRTVSGDGVFYIRSHGGMGSIRRDGSTQDLYALWTSSEVLDPLVEEQDAKLVADLLQQRVVYMLFRNDRWNQAFPSLFERNRHYGITSKFVSHYMSFAADSLIYVDACNSATDAGFRAAFPNGSLFVGWDERTEIAGAARTAQFVFDRLLGANQFAPESPKQRPFDHQALGSDPKFGPGKTYGSSRAVASDGMTAIVANLGFYPLRGDFGLLAPSLYALQADEERRKLILHGNFGPDPGGDGQVIISEGGGETALPVTSWGAHRIEATLQASGAGSRGNVKVVVRGHESNSRQLIGWKGTMTFNLDDVGSMVMRVELDMLLRMDPLDVRDGPGQAPKKTPLTVGGRNPDMTASFELGGSFTTSHDGCTFTYEWAGSGEIPFGLPTNPSRFYDYCGNIDVGRSVMQTYGMAMDTQGADLKVTVSCDGTTSSNNGPAPVLGATVPFGQAEAFWLDLPVDAALNLSGSSRTTTIHSTIPEMVPDATLHLDWSTIAAVPAYDATLPR